MRTPAAIAIPNLLHRYGELIDAGDLAGAAEMFRHARIVSDGAVIEGVVAIREMWEGWIRFYPDGTPRTKHLITNPIIDLDEAAGTAACRCHWTVLQAAPGFPLQVIATGRYHDRFECADGVWRFAERDYARIDLIGDMTAHLLKPPPFQES